jgi:hypothetical protein
MSFPATPTNGQRAVVNNINYTYNAANNIWTRSPSIVTMADTAVLGNVITTAGVFWSNGNAYSSGSAVTTTTGFATNPNTITTNVAINSGYNAQAVGPITVASGGILTVIPGQRVVIL